MRKSLAALQLSLVFAFAFAVASPKTGVQGTFDPQPDPPAAFGWSNPGSYVSLNPQPLPPRYKYFFGW